MAFFTLPVHAQYLTTKVVDGDTAYFIDNNKKQIKVRLQGIDAPERKQPFYMESKRYLLKLIGGKTVSLKCDKKDRYKREVCTIYLDDLDVNLALVKAGLAWHYKKYSFEQSIFDRKRYSSSEVTARKSKKGLWIEETPLAPWDWRRKKKNSKGM